MTYQKLLAAMISPLCSWYRENKRALPWRETKDPYCIWVSEIMLQQTRVEAALPYYRRFLDELPTVEALAAATLPRLLKLWEGLGYYSRVQNMQKAAAVITEQYGGQFPSEVKALERLPGIGDYTAGAVASIAFGLPAPAVDGNVLRVIARLCNDKADIMLPQTKRQVKENLAAVYPLADDCSDLTQALMELGALICIPGTPKCEQCPLASLCRGHHAGREQLLPVRGAKKDKKLVKRTVFLLQCGEQLALVKRPSPGVLAGMWEFPALDGHLSFKEAREQLTAWGIQNSPQPFISSCHTFTHLIWDMQSYFVWVTRQPEQFFWFSFSELEQNVALPSAVKPFYRAVMKKQ